MAMTCTELMTLMDGFEDMAEITVMLAMLKIEFNDRSDGEIIDLEVKGEDGIVRFNGRRI